MSTADEKRQMSALRQKRYREREKIRKAEMSALNAKLEESKTEYDRALEERVKKLSTEVSRWILIAIAISNRIPGGNLGGPFPPEIRIGLEAGYGTKVYDKVKESGLGNPNRVKVAIAEFRKLSGVDEG